MNKGRLKEKKHNYRIMKTRGKLMNSKMAKIELDLCFEYFKGKC